MIVALDATYSIGTELSGVGVYSREVLGGLATYAPKHKYLFCYRPHRYLKSYSETLPENCSRFLMHDRWRVPTRANVFHALNQRLPEKKLRASVTTFHDLFVMTGEYSTPEFRERFTAQARHAAMNSDIIIAVSEFTATQVTGLLGFPRERLRVIHHGVRTPSQRSIVSREKMVLHVGAIQKRKNVGRLVQAFETMPSDWHLVLAGSNGYGAEAILEQIERSAARSRIRVTGYVSPIELEELYARASMLAFPSLDEGFGIPVLEAMVRGVPVVTSNGSALQEVAGGAALLVDALNVDALASALRSVAEDENVRGRLIRDGLSHASNFTWEKTVYRIASVYQELA